MFDQVETQANPWWPVDQGQQAIPDNLGQIAPTVAMQPGNWQNAPYGFQSNPWQTQPWTNPWMPWQQVGQAGVPDPATAMTGAPNAAQPTPVLSPYLTAGTSADIPGFDPTAPGGGMHQQQLGAAQAPAPAAAPAAAPSSVYQTRGGLGGGRVYADRPSVRQAATRHNYDAADGMSTDYTMPVRTGAGTGLVGGLLGGEMPRTRDPVAMREYLYGRRG